MARTVGALRTWWLSLRFRQLCSLIVIALLVTPLLQHHAILWLVFQFIFLNALLVAVSAVHGNPHRLRVVVLSCWVVSTILKIVCVVTNNTVLLNDLLAITGGVDAVLVGTCVVVVLRYVLSTREVDSERIFAAVVAYFLLAFTFASIYDLLVTVRPESFQIAGVVSETHPLHIHNELLYFSFVTITTLGYGDITPVLQLARMLCIIEAVVGQFYIAVVIAWLVSAYASSQKS